MVYLGFPDTLLAKIQEECDGKYCYQTLDSDHVVISYLPAVENFIEWKKSVLGTYVKKDGMPFAVKNENIQSEELDFRIP